MPNGPVLLRKITTRSNLRAKFMFNASCDATHTSASDKQQQITLTQ